MRKGEEMEINRNKWGREISRYTAEIQPDNMGIFTPTQHSTQSPGERGGGVANTPRVILAPKLDFSVPAFT